MPYDAHIYIYINKFMVISNLRFRRVDGRHCSIHYIRF